jgi:hypothetical protein
MKSNSPGKNIKYRRPYGFSPQRTDTKPVTRSKKLDMRKMDEFNFMLSKAVESLPDSIRGQIKGSIYSMASRKGAKEAKDYIVKKFQEGVLDQNLEKKLLDLLYDYSKYR